jgi:hypothetical protein
MTTATKQDAASKFYPFNPCGHLRSPGWLPPLCQEDKARLLAELKAPGGLMGPHGCFKSFNTFERRYCGVRKKVFDLRRAACIQNLETCLRRLESSPAQVG